jgi:hypothetical protein
MSGKVAVMLCLAGLLGFAGCGGGGRTTVIATFPLDDLENVVQKDDEEISIDQDETTDGSGSLYIHAGRKRVVRLFQVMDPQVDNCLLTWTAQVKCASVFGNVYLEMWCRLPGEGEFFGRGLDTAIQRSTDWTEMQTHFRLEKGQKPDRVRLNLIIESGGHVWVDDVKLTTSPLPRSS